MKTEFQKAEDIVATILQLERADAVRLIATHLHQTWAEGFTAGLKNATETQATIMDMVFGPSRREQAKLNRETQRDYDEEREHGWSVG